MSQRTEVGMPRIHEERLKSLDSFAPPSMEITLLIMLTSKPKVNAAARHTSAASNVLGVRRRLLHYIGCGSGKTKAPRTSRVVAETT